VDTYDSDFSAKVIMMTWHANIARRSAGLGTLLNSEDHDVAEAFYTETVTCLQQAGRHVDVIEVLEDFSQEVLSDLELKDITFRSRELIINCLQLLHSLLFSPAYQTRERGRNTEILPTHANRERIAAEIKKAERSARNNRHPGGAEPGLFHSASGVSLGYSDSEAGEDRELMSVEQQQKLKVIAVDRMKLIFCVLKVPHPYL
jgi:hypothetical protein